MIRAFRLDHVVGDHRVFDSTEQERPPSLFRIYHVPFGHFDHYDIEEQHTQQEDENEGCKDPGL